MKRNILGLIAMICIGTLSLNAQLNEGTMVLEIIDVTSDNPQVAAMSDMLMGNQTTVYFKDNQSMTKMNMMGGMVQIDIRIDEEETSDMLMDMMGQKIWINTPKLEADRMKAEMDNPFEEMEITYDQEDTKEVAGYNCYKMVVVFPDQEGAILEAYVTEELSVNAPVIQGVEIQEFAGFPLEYTFNNGMMNMTITTASFENTVDVAVFEINTDGYQKMTMEELIEMSGGMGGFGF